MKSLAAALDALLFENSAENRANAEIALQAYYRGLHSEREKTQKRVKIHRLNKRIHTIGSAGAFRDLRKKKHRFSANNHRLSANSSLEMDAELG